MPRFPQSLDPMSLKLAPVRMMGGGLALLFVLGVGFGGGCSHSGPGGNNEAASPAPSGSPNSSVDIKAVMDKYASLDTSRDSTTRLRANVQSAGGPAEQIGLTISRERDSDGSLHFLIEFTTPPDERDRDAIINVSPSGDIEAIRYGQATKSFLTAKSPTDEESLFGLTLQELVGGEPEKYDYRLLDEETYEGAPSYRVEGTIKPGFESRFPRTVMVISRQNDTAELIEAYDSHNELARRMTADKTEQVSGIWTRLKWSIDNQEQHKTIDFDVIDVKYNQNLPGSLFTKDHLKQIASK